MKIPINKIFFQDNKNNDLFYANVKKITCSYRKFYGIYTKNNINKAISIIAFYTTNND